MTWEIRQGDALTRLREMPDESVHCCVTSPPYWGLRDYGTAEWEGGDPDCDHRVGGQVPDGMAPASITRGVRPGVDASRCLDCGATRVDRQLGLEPTPDAYVASMVEIFEEVRRVLRPEGTLWLNLGDSYASKARGSDRGWEHSRLTNPGTQQKVQAASMRSTGERHRGKSAGLKDKDLVGIPWRVAFALQAAGWWLRSDIIWSKSNPMPESITDRPTKSHEYLFLLTKSRRYFYDQEATRQPDKGADHPRTVLDGQASLDPSGGIAAPHRGLRTAAGRDGRGANLRTVWEIATRPFPGAHFATFPVDLVERCIRAGAAEATCSNCGAPWQRGRGDRVLDLSRPQSRRAQELFDGAGLSAEHLEAIRACGVTDAGKAQVTQAGFGRNDERVRLLADEAKDVLGGYYREFLLARPSRGELEPTCEHPTGGGTAVVLDPFAGAATTGLVATRLDRDFIGIELNPDYVELGRRRIRDDAPLLNVQAEAAA